MSQAISPTVSKPASGRASLRIAFDQSCGRRVPPAPDISRVVRQVQADYDFHNGTRLIVILA